MSNNKPKTLWVRATEVVDGVELFIHIDISIEKYPSSDPSGKKPYPESAKLKEVILKAIEKNL